MTRTRTLIKIGFQVGFIVGLIFLMVWLSPHLAESDFISNLVQSYGYIGIFLLAVVSGFNLIVPVPAIAFFSVFVEVGMNPIITVLVIAFGMTMGDFVGYVIGNTGKNIVDVTDNKMYKRMTKWKEKNSWYPLIGLFLYACFAPLPNELIVIPAGFIGYKHYKVLLPVLLGNIVFNSLAAFGLVTIFH